MGGGKSSPFVADNKIPNICGIVVAAVDFVVARLLQFSTIILRTAITSAKHNAHHPHRGFTSPNSSTRHECVRLINHVVGALIKDNTITDCGIHDYIFGGAKNGEGIYIGTSSSQVRRFESFHCQAYLKGSGCRLAERRRQETGIHIENI